MERSREGVFWMEYLHVSSDSNSFANRLSSSSYVDPPSFSVQLTPDTHHPESVPESVSAGRRSSSSSFHSKRQPAVAIILQVRRLKGASCNRRLPFTMKA